ncbi:hypothetical protein [Bradyrhizobium sp. 164]|uniref:hypothetical protein n=1 Tax=Bradyrhizobium sp. 164 TaxID=2782637 RepID=UPI001FFAD807|nr:hypothetical protein [Bradyrhizobium sp. 164]
MFCDSRRQGLGNNYDHGLRGRMFLLSTGQVRRPTKSRISRKVSSVEDFKKCLARVPAAVDLSFSGYSEPWLNPDCTEMVEHAHASGHGIRISTSLVGMNGRDLRHLQALDFRVFLVHVFEDGTYMNSGLVGRKYVDLMRQLIDAEVSSLLFMVLGEIHPNLV